MFNSFVHDDDGGGGDVVLGGRDVRFPAARGGDEVSHVVR